MGNIPQTQFKDGDTVRITGKSSRSGESGTVLTSASGSGESYWVKFGDGAVDLYDAELLEPEG